VFTPPSNAPTAFTLLAKPTGALCNLACEYCFYLDREQLYPGSLFHMADEVLEAYIRQLLASQQVPEVSVAWQGGEPMLMGLDFFKRSVDLVKKYKQPFQNVSYTLQTNGTRLDDEWCSFFKEHNFLIGLSLDGPRGMHDAYRVDKGGRGTYDQVKHGWDLLQKHRVKTNILCAVHAENALHPLDVYRFFRDDLQAKFIQFIPIVERLVPVARGPQGKHSRHAQKIALVSLRSVKPGLYGAFLTTIFDEWVHHDVGTIFVQVFDSALASWCHLPANVCIFQETCGLSLVLEHNGDLYSCDHFVDPSHRLGNILETPMLTLVASSPQRQFGLDKRDRLPASCRQCDVQFACRGECPRNRFIRSPGGEQGLNYLCEGYKLFFHHVDQPMRLMAALLQQGQAPAEVMHLV
jgi:uncharacterized protein